MKKLFCGWSSIMTPIYGTLTFKKNSVLKSEIPAQILDRMGGTMMFINPFPFDDNDKTEFLYNNEHLPYGIKPLIL